VPAFDVSVVGGGPAGAATCLRLAGGGLRVGLFERSHFQAPRVGEVLAPAVGELLQRLGVGQDIDHAGFVRCHGISSAWGSDRPRFHDFVFGTHGWGWQVERRAFDSMLCTAASTRATEVHLGAVVRSCHHLPDHGWRLTVAQAGGLQVYWARFLVIATGRFGLRGTLADQPPIRDDRLIGLVRYVDATASAISPTLACIEAVRDGWWYLARLPDQVAVAAYLTDVDLLPGPGRTTQRRWSSLVESASLIRSLLQDRTPRSSPRLVGAGSWRRTQVVGNRCLAVGDSVLAHDPLSGQGVAPGPGVGDAGRRGHPPRAGGRPGRMLGLRGMDPDGVSGLPTAAPTQLPARAALAGGDVLGSPAPTACSARARGVASVTGEQLEPTTGGCCCGGFLVATRSCLVRHAQAAGVQRAAADPPPARRRLA